MQKTSKKYLFLFLFILCTACLTASCGREIVVPTYDEEVEPADEVSMFAIVSNLDEVNQKITLRAVSYTTEISLNFNGGADVRDKYGDILSMSQVELGSVVDVVYDANRDKLLSLHMSTNDKVQRLQEISGAVIDYAEQTIRIDGKLYPMSKNITAFSNNSEIGLDEICSEDQLTIWMYNDIVCSLYVELGHGYVKLSDYAYYIGGMVEIGYDVIVPVTEDMILTVREGEYTLRIAKGSDVGTKTVKVVRNQEIDVSLADLIVEPKQMGSILFKVEPADAAVYIDGRRVNTEGAVDVVYGRHKIDIMADGYQSYSAIFNVDFAYTVKEYALTATGQTTGSSSTTQGNTSTSNKTTEKGKNKTTTEKSSDKNGTTEKATTEKATTEDPNVKDVSTTTGTKTNNKVVLSTPIGASVYFDGEYLGIAPISFTKVTGSHIITFSKLGYLSKSYTVTFTDDGKDVPLKYDELVSISSLIN